MSLEATRIIVLGGGVGGLTAAAHLDRQIARRSDVEVTQSTRIRAKRSSTSSKALEYEIEGQPTATVEPGDVLFVPAGAVHWATNVGSDNGAEIATYIVEKGKPLIT